MFFHLKELSNKNDKEVLSAIQHLPTTITVLSLKNNKLCSYEKKNSQGQKNRKGPAIAEAFAAIHQNVTSLDISRNFFITADQNNSPSILPFILSKLPSNIKHLSLGGNNLFIDSNKTLELFFDLIPKTVTSLDLSFNTSQVSSLLDAKALGQAFAKLPKNLTHLSLEGNEFENDQLEAILISLAELPHLKSLSLKDNKLLQNNDDLGNIMSLIPPQVVHLDLSVNGLLALVQRDELQQYFSKLPVTVRSLALNESGVYKMNSTNLQLAEAVSLIPKHIQHLELANITANLDNLPLIVSHISANITSLSLTAGSLSRASKEILIQIFKALPPTLSTIDLSDNHFQISPQDLAEALSHLPVSIKCVYLKNNNLGQLSQANIVTLCTAIPAHVKSINLEDNALFSVRTRQERDDLLTAFPEPRTRFVLGKNGESTFSRAIAPFLSAARQGALLPELVDLILRFTLNESPTEVTAQTTSQAINNAGTTQQIVSSIDAKLADFKKPKLCKTINPFSAEIKAFKALKTLILAPYPQNQQLFIENLSHWYTKHQNCLHSKGNFVQSFFKPKQTVNSIDAINQIFTLLKIEEEMTEAQQKLFQGT